MKIYYFASLIFQAFKQTSNGWAFVIEDTLNEDSYICCAYPVRSTNDVCPNTADQLLAMTKDEL